MLLMVNRSSRTSICTINCGRVLNMSSTSVPLGQALYYKETVFIVEVGKYQQYILSNNAMARFRKKVKIQ